MVISLVALWLLTSIAPNQAIPPRENADRERAMLHYQLGWEGLRAEAFGDAVREFKQAIEIDKKFKLAYYGLGRSHMGLRQFGDAAAAYESCRELYQAQVGENFKNRLDADLMRRDDAQQLQIAIQQMSKGPQTTQTQEQIRQLNRMQQRLSVKQDVGIELSMGNAVPAFVSLALGSAYFRAERMTDAERQYRSAIEADPKAGEAHNNLAVVLTLTGRFDEADKEIALAEKSGFRVNPELKKDLAARRARR